MAQEEHVSDAGAPLKWEWGEPVVHLLPQDLLPQSGSFDEVTCCKTRNTIVADHEEKLPIKACDSTFVNCVN